MLDAIPIRSVLVVGWLCFAIEVLFVAGLLRSRHMGDDAAGRGLGTAYGMVLAPIVLVVGGTLLWGTSTNSRPAIVAGSLLSALPFLVMMVLGVRGLVQKGGRAWVRTGQGSFASAALTDLARAIDRADPAEVKQLVRGLSADWRARDKFNRTLLGHAVHKARDMYATAAHIEIVGLLLDSGVPYAADAVEPGTDWTALLATDATDSRNALIEIALAHGADANARDPWDDQPILFSSNMTPSKADLLIAHGADVQSRCARADRPQWTAMMNAIADGRWDMARYFLDRRVPADYVAPDGRSVTSLLTDADALARRMGHKANENAQAFRLAMQDLAATAPAPSPND